MSSRARLICTRRIVTFPIIVDDAAMIWCDREEDPVKKGRAIMLLAVFWVNEEANLSDETRSRASPIQ